MGEGVLPFPLTSPGGRGHSPPCWGESPASFPHPVTPLLDTCTGLYTGTLSWAGGYPPPPPPSARQACGSPLLPLFGEGVGGRALAWGGGVRGLPLARMCHRLPLARTYHRIPGGGGGGPAPPTPTKGTPYWLRSRCPLPLWADYPSWPPKGHAGAHFV